MTTPTKDDAELIERLTDKLYHAKIIMGFKEWKCHAENLIGDAIARLKQGAGEERWISLSERKPTEEDGRYGGLVMAYYRTESVRGQALIHFSCFHSNYAENKDYTHWRRLPAPPAEPTPDEKQADADEAAFRIYASDKHSYDARCDAWHAALAYRDSQSARAALTQPAPAADTDGKEGK